MNIKKSILLRVRVAFILIFVFSLAIITKMGVIQFVEGEKWAEEADRTTFKYRKIKATRGNIYSDNGSLLATSLPFYRVAFDPTVASDEVYRKGVSELSKKLSTHFKDRSADRYYKKINTAREEGREYLILSKQPIDHEVMKEMTTWPIFEKGRYKGGIIFEKVDRRFRPFSGLGKRTIGYVNENNRGVGLEYSFNNELAGKDGLALYQKIAGSNWKPVFDGSEVRTEHGLDIETTIDVNLQDVSETALLRAIEEHEADYGTVIVMEVATGEIKAISNLSRTKGGYYAEMYNYAVGSQGLREPGSTFKLATMMALLDQTNIKLSDTIDTGDGVLPIFKEKIRDHQPGGLGKITIKEAFEQSSNIAMAKLVQEHFGDKPERFTNYIDDIGLSKPLGFQMVGEGVPKIKRPGQNGWSGITLAWMSHGYGLELTPLQTLSLYNAVANDGRMIKPIIVKRIKDADRVERTYNTKTITKRVCSEGTLKKLKVMLEGVVENGTAGNIKDSHYKIAGKTGTAQILENGRYTKKYITSFAGYFPAKQPKYSAIVLIKNPKGWRQYGSNVAAPVFKEIADNIYSRDIELHDPMPEEFVADYGVFPVIRAGHQEELKMICDELGITNHSEHDGEWVKTKISGNAVVWNDNTASTGTMPDVRGMTLRDAIYVLESNGLSVRFEGNGRVVKQSQLPGAKIQKGNKVTITLS